MSRYLTVCSQSREEFCSARRSIGTPGKFRFQLLAFALACIVVPSTVSAQPGQGRRPGGGGGRGEGRGGGRQPIVLTQGQLPDVDALTADGKPIKVRDLIEGKYTVFKTGCLTCQTKRLVTSSSRCTTTDAPKRCARH
jgi:hypothetical protein